MKKPTLILLLSASAIFTIFSCKKSSSNSPSADANVEGSWLVTKQYLDTIGNGVFSTAELLPGAYYANQVWQFNANGVLSYPNNSAFDTQNWKLANNNTTLEIIDTVYGVVSIDYDAVLTLTSSSLELKDTSGLSTIWTFLTKQ